MYDKANDKENVMGFVTFSIKCMHRENLVHILHATDGTVDTNLDVLETIKCGGTTGSFDESAMQHAIDMLQVMLTNASVERIGLE